MTFGSSAGSGAATGESYRRPGLPSSVVAIRAGPRHHVPTRGRRWSCLHEQRETLEVTGCSAVTLGPGPPPRPVLPGDPAESTPVHRPPGSGWSTGRASREAEVLERRMRTEGPGPFGPGPSASRDLRRDRAADVLIEPAQVRAGIAAASPPLPPRGGLPARP